MNAGKGAFASPRPAPRRWNGGSRRVDCAVDFSFACRPSSYASEDLWDAVVVLIELLGLMRPP